MGRKRTKVDVRIIPIDAINDPKMLVRDDMGSREENLELGQSIKETGQIQPIVVCEIGDRFDLIVGHRRVYAARLVGLVSIEAKIIDVDNEQMAIMRYKENNERMQNNPYEEALFIREMLNNIGCSQVELSKKLSRSAAYVTQRLAILDGYPCVRDAVRAKEINFAQARELLLMPDEGSAKQYLDIAKKGGAKADLIRSWRNDLVHAYKKIEEGPGEEIDHEEQRQLVRIQFLKCEMCSAVTDPVDLTYMKVCSVCYKTLLGEIAKCRK